MSSIISFNIFFDEQHSLEKYFGVYTTCLQAISTRTKQTIRLLYTILEKGFPLLRKYAFLWVAANYDNVDPTTQPHI